MAIVESKQVAKGRKSTKAGNTTVTVTDKKSRASAQRVSDNLKVAEGIMNGVTAKPGKKQKPVVTVPPDQADNLKVVVNTKIVEKALDHDKRNADSQTLEFFTEFSRYTREEWVKEFVRTGAHPPMTQFTNGEDAIDFVQTRRMDLTQIQVDTCAAIGFDIAEHIKNVGVTIDRKAMEKYKVTEKVIAAVTKAIATIPGITPEAIEEILVPEVSAKESLYDDLLRHVRASLPGKSPAPEKVEERMLQVLEILNPVSQLRSPITANSTVTEALDQVINTVAVYQGIDQQD